MESFRDIIELWEVPADLAAEFPIKSKITPQQVYAWWKRDSIPAHAFTDLAAACAKRGRDDIDEKRLSEIAKLRKYPDHGNDQGQAAAEERVAAQ